MNRTDIIKYIEKHIAPIRKHRITFSKANTKLKKLQKQIGKRVYSFDLLAGWTCPYAKDCRSCAAPQHLVRPTTFFLEQDSGRVVVDGPQCRYRCYSASQEAIYRDTFNQRAMNWWCLITPYQNVTRMADMLLRSIPRNAEVIRIHSSGDFFSSTYFKAWLKVTKARPDIHFYGYTKAISLLQKHKDSIPSNLRITQSTGGTSTDYVDGLPKSYVVLYEESAASQNIPIDYNDFLAYEGKEDFALLIHGTQPAGTRAARALAKQRA